MSMFFQSLIDVDTWNNAKWLATAYFVSEHPSDPPVLGLFFEQEVSARKIFTDLIDRIDNNDPYNELRVAIIEGELRGKQGYSVHISSNPENTIKRASEKGISIDADQIVVVSRVHRMTPEPNSPHLANFKKAYAQQNRYLIIPVTGSAQAMKPHFDLSIGKQPIHFRHISDVGNNDRDAVIFDLSRSAR